MDVSNRGEISFSTTICHKLHFTNYPKSSLNKILISNCKFFLFTGELSKALDFLRFNATINNEHAKCILQNQGKFKRVSRPIKEVEMLLDINKEHVEKSNSLYNEMVQKFKEKIKLSPCKQ